jgi:uncharacterized membrane protein HdeD (DUF308 family)
MAAFEGFWNFLSHIPWYAWIAIVVLVGGIIRQVVSMSHKHQERMEMIRQGIDPRDVAKK